jgi:hypothetical protein
MKKQLLILFACFITILNQAQNPTFQWAIACGGTVTQRGEALVTDPSGNVYTTGWFIGTVDFDPGLGVYNLTSVSSVTGAGDVFVLKLDALGNFIWAKRMGGSLGSFAFSIGIDGAGNIVTTGNFNGTADFDPGVGTFTLNANNSGNGGAFISKLDPSGNFVWAKAVSSPGPANGASLKVTTLGDIYLTGSFHSIVDFDPGVGTYTLSSAGYNDVFVLKLNAAGNFVWAINIGSTNFDLGYDLDLDAAENVYITGIFRGTTDFDPGSQVFNLTGSLNGDVFVLKLDMNGNFLLATSITGTGIAVSSNIRIDGNGNIIVVGKLSGTIDFDPGIGTSNLTSAGNSSGNNDIFILKLDPLTNFIFAKKLGSTGNDIATAVTVDVFNCIYTTGYFSNTVDFDPGAASYTLNTTGQSVFISKLSPAGTFMWATKFSSNNSIGLDITVDAAGTIAVTGGFDGSGDFDPVGGSYILTSIGSGDIFVHTMTSTLITDLHERPIDPNISIYPNPNNGVFNLKLNKEVKNGKLILYNVLGEIVLTKDVNEELNIIESVTLTKGVYFYNITSTNTLLQKGKIILD